MLVEIRTEFSVSTGVGDQDGLKNDTAKLHDILDTYGIKTMFRLSWKWRERSSVKIAERTYEKRAQTLHS
jgi:hypothetical protein